MKKPQDLVKLDQFPVSDDDKGALLDAIHQLVTRIKAGTHPPNELLHKVQSLNNLKKPDAQLHYAREAADYSAEGSYLEREDNWRRLYAVTGDSDDLKKAHRALVAGSCDDRDGDEYKAVHWRRYQAARRDKLADQYEQMRSHDLVEKLGGGWAELVKLDQDSRQFGRFSEYLERNWQPLIAFKSNHEKESDWDLWLKPAFQEMVDEWLNRCPKDANALLRAAYAKLEPLRGDYGAVERAKKRYELSASEDDLRAWWQALQKSMKTRLAGEPEWMFRRRIAQNLLGLSEVAREEGLRAKVLPELWRALSPAVVTARGRNYSRIEALSYTLDFQNQFWDNLGYAQANWQVPLVFSDTESFLRMSGVNLESLGCKEILGVYWPCASETILQSARDFEEFSPVTAAHVDMFPHRGMDRARRVLYFVRKAHGVASGEALVREALTPAYNLALGAEGKLRFEAMLYIYRYRAKRQLSLTK